MGQDAVATKMLADGKFATDIANELGIINEKMKPYADTFPAFVAEFYSGNKWSFKVLGKEVKTDYQSQATFSLANISAAITVIAKNILAGGKALTGADPSATAKDLAAAGGNIAVVGIDTAVTAAVACITSVMGLFDTSAKGSISQGMESHRIAPGLTLHAYGYSTISGAEDAVKTASLLMSVTGYRLCYSFDQAQVEQEMTYMNFIDTELTKYEKEVESMTDVYDQMNSDPSKTQADIDAWKTRMDKAALNIQDYRKLSDDLIKKFSSAA